MLFSLPLFLGKRHPFPNDCSPRVVFGSHARNGSRKLAGTLRSSSGLDGGWGGYFTGFVILVPVKEARDPLLQLSGVTGLTHGNCVVEEIPLNLRRQIIPLHGSHAALLEKGLPDPDPHKDRRPPMIISVLPNIELW